MILSMSNIIPRISQQPPQKPKLIDRKNALLSVSSKTALISPSYERGWPSYYNVYLSMKIVGVRGVLIRVRKMAANSSDCALSKCTVHPLKCATKVLRLASTEIFFYGHP
jgi:hypothetical protein